jgi:hypothetical protein
MAPFLTQQKSVLQWQQNAPQMLPWMENRRMIVMVGGKRIVIAAKRTPIKNAQLAFHGSTKLLKGGTYPRKNGQLIQQLKLSTITT